MKKIGNTGVYHYRAVQKCIIRAISEGTPFSLWRIGDGELKFFHRYKKFVTQNNFTSVHNLTKDEFGYVSSQFGKRTIVEGIRAKDLKWTMDSFKTSSDNADFISSFAPWDLPNFWRKPKGIGLVVLKDWRNLYNFLGITNIKCTTPDVNFLLISNPLMMDVIKEHHFVCMASELFTKYQHRLRNNGFTFDVIPIPFRKHNVEQYYPKSEDRLDILTGNCHSDLVPKICCRINEKIREGRKIFLIGAGFYAKIYSHHIKNMGGIAIDMGHVFDYWESGVLPTRLTKIVTATDKGITATCTKLAKQQIDIVG